jgi:hypothetical protein
MRLGGRFRDAAVAFAQHASQLNFRWFNQERKRKPSIEPRASFEMVVPRALFPPL